MAFAGEQERRSRPRAAARSPPPGPVGKRPFRARVGAPKAPTKKMPCRLEYFLFSPTGKSYPQFFFGKKPTATAIEVWKQRGTKTLFPPNKKEVVNARIYFSPHGDRVYITLTLFPPRGRRRQVLVPLSRREFASCRHSRLCCYFDIERQA